MNELANLAVAALWQSTIIAGAVLLASPLLARVSVRIRHAMLVAVLAACGVVPLLRFVPAAQATGGGAVPVIAPPQVLVNAIAVAYLLMLAYAVASLAYAVRAARVLRRSGERAGCPRYLVSDLVRVPVTVGVWRPVILIPRDLPADTLDAVLRHELAHVARRDGLLQMIVEFATLPVAWHPLVVALKRRAAAAREMRCDELAVSHHDARSYANVLLRLAEAETLPRYALAFGDADALEARLRALRERSAGSVRCCIITTLALAAIVAGVAHYRFDAFAPQPNLSGSWTLDRSATQYGPIRAYEGFTQTIAHDGRSLSNTQVRVRGGRASRTRWRVTIDGKPHAFGRGKGVARYDGNAVVMELSTPGGHWERVTTSVAPDGKTLVCNGEVRDGNFRFVFRRQS